MQGFCDQRYGTDRCLAHFQDTEKANSVSVYQHYVDCCAELGIDIIPAMDRMIVVDYIIANEDRHLNNFGLVREMD